MSEVRQRNKAHRPEPKLSSGSSTPTTVSSQYSSSAQSQKRRYAKFFFGIVSFVCFSFALWSSAKREGIAHILERPVSSHVGNGRAKSHPFQSSLPFALDSRPPPSKIVRSADLKRQAAVKTAIKDSWEAYVEDAFGADEYHPISRTGSNFSAEGGVGYFIVDTIDLLLITGEKEGYRKARDWIKEMDWSNRRGRFSVFETTIRTLGGLLSAHALCEAGLDTLTRKTSKLCSPQDADMFLEKAVALAERLRPAFEQTRLGIPFREVDFQSGEAFPDVDNQNLSSLAEVTTIQLEFKYLAHATGDVDWWTLAEKPMKAIRKAALASQTGGILPIFISPHTGELRLSSIRLGSRGDSYYEYLVKQYVQTKEPIYAAMWREALEAIKKYLLRQSMQAELLYTTEIEPRFFPQAQQPMFVSVPKQDHLVCFLGGSVMLGAVHIPREMSQSNEEGGSSGGDSDHDIHIMAYPPKSHATLSELAQEDLVIGHELTRTCMETYKGTKTGLAAEITMFRVENDRYTGRERDWYIKKGSKGADPLIDARNILRPETVESLFTAFHLTGDEIYREWGWEIFQSFVRAARIGKGEKGREGAFSSIRDVQAEAGKIEREDRMETFWLAETLKYLYLLFSDQDILRLDQWVLNTEAHPLPIFQPTFETTVT